MALTDGLLVQVYPVSGDAGIKDIVSDTLFTGAGSPTLITDEGISAWSIPTGTLLTKLLTERTISGAVAGDGVTVAMRFKLTANGTNSFLSLAGFKGSADTVDQNIRITRNGSNNYRGRVNATLSPTLTGLTNGTVITLVFRVSFRDGSLDTGELWRNTIGRVGTDPDSVSAGANFGSMTFDRAFINCQTDSEYILYDFSVWGRELTSAEGAAVADDYRAVMPTPGATVTPIEFTGSIADQVFTEGDDVLVNLATGNYTGTETPFSYANTGTALTGTGLSITSNGLLSGTATVGSSAAVVITGTDTGTNTANSNAFSVTVNAVPELPPQGTVSIGTITTGETTASVPFSYSASDQTGFEYRLDAGIDIAVTSNPIELAGLTDSTAYDIEVRAVNAVGAGTWSAVAEFTTDTQIAVDPIIIFGADTALSFNTGGLRPNLTDLSVDIYDVVTRGLILSVTGHTTGADAVLDDIQNAVLTAATEYRIVVLGADGSEAVFRETSQ